jgi:hypothetical protein
MDSFDQVRLKASRRSNSVIQEGCNPLKPLAVVEAAAKSLELDLIELSSGDPALKGARALYDDQSGAICFEQTSVVADRALLVAHRVALHRRSIRVRPAKTAPPEFRGLKTTERRNGGNFRPMYTRGNSSCPGSS